MYVRRIDLGIVDDHTLIRIAIKDFISRKENINVVIQASNAFDLVAKLKNTSIDVLLTDLFMPESAGEETVKIIMDEYPDIKIIVLSACADIDLIKRLLDLGIYGYISKVDEPESLFKAIVSASENRIYRNRFFTEALYQNRQNSMQGRTNNVVFDDREKKILQLLWEEKSNKEIANEVFLSVRSVEKIRQQMKEKTGVKSTIGLMKNALDNKVIGYGRNQNISTIIS